MKFHPYAEVFPKLSEPELRELADDIKAHGQREKIWTYKGQILDGRNRFNACVLAGVRAKFRPFSGTDAEALALVISVNMTRRHLTTEQRAIAAAKVATLRDGQKKSPAAASREAADAPSQGEAADTFGVSRSSVQRARKVVEQGSAALQKAVESGDVPLSKAAAVVDLPKSEQLKAATAKPTKNPEPEDDGSAPDDNEEEILQLAAKEREASIAKVLASDDKLAAAAAEIDRQAAEIASLKVSRDGFMNGKAEYMKLLEKEQRKTARLDKRIAELEKQLEKRAA